MVLADLPGAGYTWTPVDVPAGLTMIDTQQETPVNPDVVGSAEHKTVRFRADRAGDYDVVFVFGRPWEDSPAETRTVRVHVHSQEPQESR